MKHSPFQKNREVLKTLLPELVERIDRVPELTEAFEFFPSREGPVTARALGPDGRWLTLHSTVNPERESATLIKRLEGITKGIVVFLGVGLGYPLFALTNRRDSEGLTVIVVERDLCLFRQALGLSDWARLLRIKKLHVLTVGDTDEILKAITRIRMKEGFQDLVVIPHKPSVRRDPDFYGPLLGELRLLEASPLRARLNYRRLAEKRLTVLVLDSSYFLIRECVKTLKKLGHKVVSIAISDGRTVEAIMAHIARDRPDFLLSVNHLGFDEEGKLAELLETVKLPHAVWYVDSPTLIISNFRRNASPYCVLFTWDRAYLEPMGECGFHRAHFLPLATDPSVFKPIRGNCIPQRFRRSVSFVGNSMVKAVEDWFGRFPHDSTTEAICRLAVPLQMENHRLPIDEILRIVAKEHGYRAEFRDPVHYLDLQAALVWKATLEYRKKLIQSLESLNICVYGDAGWHQILNGGAKICPSINYYKELPMVFNGTEVNINATSFQMNSAVNQRVFDAACCGAFLVTDHQPDMDTLFDVECEAVCYEDPAQARDQVAYYLKHRKDRRQIAERGRQRVLAEHTYVHRLQRMISILRDEFGSF